MSMQVLAVKNLRESITSTFSENEGTPLLTIPGTIPDPYVAP
jgi:hypothetical protein